VSDLEIGWRHPRDYEIWVFVLVAKNIGFRDFATARVTEDVEWFSAINCSINPSNANRRLDPCGTKATPLVSSSCRDPRTVWRSEIMLPNDGIVSTAEKAAKKNGGDGQAAKCRAHRFNVNARKVVFSVTPAGFSGPRRSLAEDHSLHIETGMAWIRLICHCGESFAGSAGIATL
jgi:hypothetical protein